ncbi:DNA invertase Pin-like site-specific DNA recombinase [Arthrobacter globiformis]|nr:DNA invertase Pin-like site-specific DNA recombinase [Arthrobacter globiformis]
MAWRLRLDLNTLAISAMSRLARKRIMTDAKIRSARKLLNQGTPPREVADTLGVSVPTLYRWIPATGSTEAPRK